jgi:protein-tyrosine phosphatase
MIPLVDIHCHLLAGLDDGPRTWDDALAMCRIAYQEGTQLVAATAHQNERWNQVTPERIRAAVQQLSQLLQRANIPLSVVPCAEITAHPDMETAWEKGQLLSVADRKQYLLVEMPQQLFVDLAPTVQRLQQFDLRVILAHPERHSELLHEAGRIEELIENGCLVQVSSGSVTDPPTSAAGRALRNWFQRGCVHLLGSDGHSPRRRPPRMADAYQQISYWAGTATADRVCSTNGLAVLQGLPLQVAAPRRKRAAWFLRFW